MKGSVAFGLLCAAALGGCTQARNSQIPIGQAPPCRDGMPKCAPEERAWTDGYKPAPGETVGRDGTIYKKVK